MYFSLHYNLITLCMNTIEHLFGIEYPIIQGGMVWCSGWKLASAVSNNGGLGLIGAGSMRPDLLREHIQKCKKATNKPFGVNIPLLYDYAEEFIKIIIDEEVKIVFTSAGNPKTWTSLLKSQNITVVHVVSSSKFALKAQEAGVDAIVAEGFEAGGHNGREETTTLCLIPEVTSKVTIPVIGAGGISSGKSIAAAFSLGASGVQIGSLFAVSEESSAHINYKNAVLQAKEGDTVLILKQLAPVRLIKNKFSEEVAVATQNGSTIEELVLLLGKGRAKKALFDGLLDDGEIETGQVSSHISSIKSVETIFSELILEYNNTVKNLVPTL